MATKPAQTLSEHLSKLVASMDIKPLTGATFVGFVQGVHGLFVPEGARFQEYFSPGYNERSKCTYDWSKGKPEWREGDILAFDRIELKEIPEEGKRWINVHFAGNLPGVWGIPNNSRRLPYKFGFNLTQSLYIAEQQGNGTPEQPWETLYVKL